MSTSGPAVAMRANRSGALDGLRGFAALAVVSGHLTLGLGLLPYESGGFIGVLVFFVLSGYLIGGICWRAPANWSAYRRFIDRRVRRLAPVILGLALLGVPLMATVGGQPLEDATRSAVLAVGQLTGFAIPLGVPWHPVWGPTWSLTVEWAFYLLFPVLLIMIRRRRGSAAFARNTLAALAGVLYVCGLLLTPLQFYILPVANFGVMLLGAALAIHHGSAGTEPRPAPDPARAVFGFILLLALSVLPVSSLGIGYKIVILPSVTLATLVIIDGCRLASGLPRLLASRPLTAVGLRAYSLYIWHTPVFWIVWRNTPDLSPFLQASLCLAVLAPVVFLSFRLLEQPWLARRSAAATATSGVGVARRAPEPV